MSNMYINIIVETSILTAETSNPSLDSDNPTKISDQYVCIVAAEERKKMMGIKSNKVSLKKRSVEQLTFNVVSESSNFDNIVILYDFLCYEGNDILEPLSLFNFEKDTIIPTSFDPLETAVVNRVFLNNRCTVLDTGKGSYGMRFAIFNENQEAVGYFEFLIVLSVK